MRFYPYLGKNVWLFVLEDTAMKRGEKKAQIPDQKRMINKPKAEAASAY